jgi:hypothetical protein
VFGVSPDQGYGGQPRFVTFPSRCFLQCYRRRKFQLQGANQTLGYYWMSIWQEKAAVKIPNKKYESCVAPWLQFREPRMRRSLISRRIRANYDFIVMAESEIRFGFLSVLLQFFHTSSI